MDRKTDIQMDGRTDKQQVRHKDRLIDKGQTVRQTDREKDRQTDRQTDREILELHREILELHGRCQCGQITPIANLNEYFVLKT